MGPSMCQLAPLPLGHRHGTVSPAALCGKFGKVVSSAYLLQKAMPASRGGLGSLTRARTCTAAEGVKGRSSLALLEACPMRAQPDAMRSRAMGMGRSEGRRVTSIVALGWLGWQLAWGMDRRGKLVCGIWGFSVGFPGAIDSTRPHPLGCGKCIGVLDSWLSLKSGGRRWSRPGLTGSGPPFLSSYYCCTAPLKKVPC